LWRNYTGCKILKRFAWPWPRPFQGIFFIGRVGLAMLSQCTKFEVSEFNRYEAMNGGAKYRKWGGLGCLGGTQGHGQCHHSIECTRLPICDFNRNYVSIFYRFRDIAGYLWKVADFDPPHLHLAPPWGVTPVEFRGDLWHQKTRVPGVSCGLVCVILRLAVLV